MPTPCPRMPPECWKASVMKWPGHNEGDTPRFVFLACPPNGPGCQASMNVPMLLMPHVLSQENKRKDVTFAGSSDVPGAEPLHFLSF